MSQYLDTIRDLSQIYLINSRRLQVIVCFSLHTIAAFERTDIWSISYR